MSPVKLDGMPNKPRTPHRTVRVSDELWHQAQAIAAARGETVSDEVRGGLERYVKRHHHLIGKDD